MVENVIQAQIFDLTGGLFCLDFVNTVDDRPDLHPRDHLNSYHDLISWSLQAHVLAEQEAQRLLEEATHRPAEAASVLERAVSIREAIYRIFKAVAEEVPPEADDLVVLSAAVADAQSHARIVPKEGGFTWDWAGDEIELGRMLWPVARSAADILTSDELDDVRVCASDSCNWLFLDTSKNHSRRWCDMKSCGNRAKARRFYGRKKSSSVVMTESPPVPVKTTPHQ
jgi:predicted RNA-binding Zn ribbon-like protein